jgi:hypothetical protein
MVFVLIGRNGSEVTLGPLVEKSFPDDHLQLGPSAWLLSASGVPTTKGVWERLVAGQNPIPNGTIFAINGYFGVASPSVWEWVRNKMQAD